jgi:hypothetical protein
MPSLAPANEAERLAALHALDIIDSAPEAAYDEITELAAQICGCPVSYISVSSTTTDDGSRQDMVCRLK